jgi:hypothetical protein
MKSRDYRGVPLEESMYRKRGFSATRGGVPRQTKGEDQRWTRQPLDYLGGYHGGLRPWIDTKMEVWQWEYPWFIQRGLHEWKPWPQVSLMADPLVIYGGYLWYGDIPCKGSP